MVNRSLSRKRGRTDPSSTATVFSTKPLLVGTLCGISTAGLFNPVDRALYLSVIHLRPFLHASNWVQPFQGASNALLHRTISGGLYFTAYDLIEKPVQKWALHRPYRNNDDAYDAFVTTFATGTLAGFVNGVVLNPIAAVKYAAWGTPDTSQGLKRFAVSLWVSGCGQRLKKNIQWSTVPGATNN